MPTSKIKMFSSSSGKTLYANSEFRKRLLQIMGHSLTVLSSKYSAQS